MQKSALVLISAVFTGLLLTACGGHASDKSNPPAPNVAPIANAGSNQSVIAGVTVALDGTLSNDPDGSIASYAWTQTAGTPVTLTSTTTAQTAFVAPAAVAVTTLTFSLVVTDNVGAASTAASMTVTVNPPTPGVITGTVRFMRIPATSNGLDYSAGQLQIARGVTVQALTAGTSTVLASTVTSVNGTYVLSVAPNSNVNVVVLSQMLRDGSQPLPNWDFKVVDEDADTEPYEFNDGVVSDTTAPVSHNIDIPSGFDSAGNQTGTRASAPFAVLDTVYKGVQLVLSVAPTSDFPALLLDWAEDNPGSNTFFEAFAPDDQHIVLSADITEDTDEFDQHVIAHEFGHYVEFNFSRADSIGGPHGLGDKLDIRVAFGEGFGYAFSAIVLGDPVTQDSFVDVACPNSQCSSTFNVEDNPATLAAQAIPAGNFGCWCSESSVWSILWDVYDTNADTNDNVALGFAPMWNVLVNQQRTTHAFTSVFSFISALKDSNAGSANAINTLVAAQNINGNGIDPYATSEFTAPPPVASVGAMPLYTDIVVGGAPMTVRNVNDAGTYNKLGNHRYLRFSLLSARTITITASSSAITGDADFVLFHDGAFYDLSWDDPPDPETLVVNNAPPGDYLIDVYDYANGGDFTLIGGDYDLTVTVN